MYFISFVALINLILKIRSFIKNKYKELHLFLVFLFAKRNA